MSTSCTAVKLSPPLQGTHTSALLADVQQQAVAHFWELLGDFVALKAAPNSWLPQITPDHPFVRVIGGSVLSVHRVAAEPAAD